jgi:hypothetical protein
MSILRLELRRSWLVWSVPLIAALTIALTIGLRLAGVLDWSDASKGLAHATVVVIPVLAAIAALESGRRYNRSTKLRLEQSNQPFVRSALAHFAAVLIWTVGGYVAGIVVYGIFVTAAGGYGSPNWLWLLASAAGIVLGVTLGYVAGALLGFRWFIPPIAAIGFYLLFIPFNYGVTGPSYWVTHLWPITDDDNDLFSGYVNLTFWGEIAWYLGAAAIIFLLLALIRSRGRVIRLALVFVAAIAVAATGAGFIQSGHADITAGYVRPAYICAGEAPKVCVAVPFKSALPALTKDFSALNAKLAGTKWAHTEYEQTAAEAFDHTDKGAASIYMQDLSPQAKPLAVEYFLQDYVLSPGGATCSEGSYIDAMIGPENWLGIPSGVDETGFTALSASAKNAWLVHNASKISDCSLRSSDLPKT